MALNDFLGICICRDQSGKARTIVRDQISSCLSWVLDFEFFFMILGMHVL